MVTIKGEVIRENTGRGRLLHGPYADSFPFAQEKRLQVPYSLLAVSHFRSAITFNGSSRIYRKEQDFISVIQFPAKIPY